MKVYTLEIVTDGEREPSILEVSEFVRRNVSSPGSGYIAADGWWITTLVAGEVREEE